MLSCSMLSSRSVAVCPAVMDSSLVGLQVLGWHPITSTRSVTSWIFIREWGLMCGLFAGKTWAGSGCCGGQDGVAWAAGLEGHYGQIDWEAQSPLQVFLECPLSIQHCLTPVFVCSDFIHRLLRPFSAGLHAEEGVYKTLKKETEQLLTQLQREVDTWVTPQMAMLNSAHFSLLPVFALSPQSEAEAQHWTYPRCAIQNQVVCQGTEGEHLANAIKSCLSSPCFSVNSHSLQVSKGIWCLTSEDSSAYL